jgi:hypothetical protein
MDATNSNQLADTISCDEFILVRMRIPDLGMLYQFFPPGNRAGTALLYEFLKARLALAGVELKLDNCSGELNSATLLFMVEARDSALEAITTALRDCGFLDLAQVGYFDCREVIFRSVPSGDVVEFNLANMQAKWLAEEKLLEELAQTCKRLGAGSQ